MNGRYWVDDLPPFLGPHWGPLGIRFYGLAYVLGFLVAGWLMVRYARAGRSLLAAHRVGDFMVAIVIGVILGGRIGSYFLYDTWRTFFSDPLAILRVWEGGMASHGGMIGVCLAVAWFSRKEHLRFLHLADIVVSAAPAGLFFGRLANFVNGELWGKVTTVPWAVIFPRSDPGTDIDHILPRHPSQLYEAGTEGLLLFAYMQLRFWRSGVVRARPGRLAGEFLLAYSAVRILCERFREPDDGISLILGLSRGTFYSLFLIAAGLFLVLRRSEPLAQPGQPTPGSTPSPGPSPGVRTSSPKE